MTTRRCRICLEPLRGDSELYHSACCKQLFGSVSAPEVPYTWDQLNELAEKIVCEHITVPGVQPKLSVHIEKSGSRHNARFTLVGMEGGFILKPPVARFPEMPELEHLTMRMAERCGIAVAKCGLIALEDGQLAFITGRMDREGKTKLHMEDMCQLTDRLTEQKYRGSMEQVGKAVLRYCDNPLFDALRLFELTLFCFLTGNADMHLKNFSLLYERGGEVSLSPAYDLLPTALLLPEDREETALTLNGRKRRLNRRDFANFAASLKLSEKQVDNVYSRMSSALVSVIEVLESGLCCADAKERFKALIEERADRLALS